MIIISKDLIDQTISETIETEGSKYIPISDLSFKNEVSTIQPRLVVTLVDSEESEIKPVPLNSYQYKKRIDSLLKLLLRTQLKTSFQNEEKLHLVYAFELMKVQIIKQLESLSAQLAKMIVLDKEWGRKKRNNLRRLRRLNKQTANLPSIKNNLNNQKGLLIHHKVSDNECHTTTDSECHVENKCHNAIDNEYVLPESYNGDILSQMRLDDVDIDIFDLITYEQ